MTKLIITQLFILCFSATVFTQGIGIGTTSPDQDAILHLEGTNKGLVLPYTNNFNNFSVHRPSGIFTYDIIKKSPAWYDGTNWRWTTEPIKLIDIDRDTWIDLEDTDDEIKVGVNGREMLTLNENTMDFGGFWQGSSVYIGDLVAQNADFTTDYNVGIGLLTLAENTGDKNIGIGRFTLYQNSGSSNIGIGDFALRTANVGINNIGIGVSALEKNSEGNSNIGIGTNALRNNRTGSANVMIGNYAGGGLGNYYDQCIAIGQSALNSSSNRTNAIAIGFFAQVTASNQVRIGSNSVTSIGGYANWTNVSDARFKENVKDDVPGLSFIEKLRPVTYQLNHAAIRTFMLEEHNVKLPSNAESTKKAPAIQSGFIAQEVEQAAQQSRYNFSGVDAPKEEGDFYGLRYAEFVMPLVKGMQELIEINKEQTKTIEQLKSRVAVLETKD